VRWEGRNVPRTITSSSINVHLTLAIILLSTVSPTPKLPRLCWEKGLLNGYSNLGCLHPVACVRSGDGGFFIRLRLTLAINIFSS
jgi:hypothetical protein